MSHNEVALKKMSIDEVIELTVEYQANFNSTLVNIAHLKSHFSILEPELSIFRSVNSKLFDRLASFENQCWTINQYTRRECFEITGLPETIENGNLEEPTLKVLYGIGVNIGSKDVEDCHWIKTKCPKKMIVFVHSM